jgi:hypothetical protein
MYCPQCGTESKSDLKYCRSCGANLKVIGKAVTLSEAIARSDSVPAKIKDLVKNLKLEKVTEEVSRAMDKMNQEIVRSSDERPQKSRWRKEKTPEQRRERHLVKGTIKLFWGGGLSIFLYFLSHALVLKLPPDTIANIPFEIDPVVRVLWLIGLIPMLSGVGHIIAGLTIRSEPTIQAQPAIQAEPQREIEFPEQSPLRIGQEISTDKQPEDEATVTTPRWPPSSVPDRTTNILHRVVPIRGTDEIKK